MVGRKKQSNKNEARRVIYNKEERSHGANLVVHEPKTSYNIDYIETFFYKQMSKKACLFEYLFYVWPSNFRVYSRQRHAMGELIMTSIEHTEKSLRLARLKPGTSRSQAVCLNRSTKELTLKHSL